MKRLSIYAAFLTFLVACGTCRASDATYSDLIAWFSEHADAPIDGLRSGTYGINQLSELSRYIPPGFLDAFNFADLQLEIVQTRSYPSHQSYREATSKHQSTVVLAADGSLEGYVSGRPFSVEDISKASQERAGLMLAWNNISRWQHDGYGVNIRIDFLRPTGNGIPGTLMPGLIGGGHVDRHMTVYYHRVYLSHLAHRADICRSETYVNLAGAYSRSQKFVRLTLNSTSSRQSPVSGDM